MDSDQQDAADVTELLQRVTQGDAEARGELLALLYDEIKCRAQGLVGKRAGTLGATALVHEAFLKLVRAGGSFEDRTHFIATASRAMRQILVDHARSKQQQKRRPTGERLPLDTLCAAYEDRAMGLEALDDALEKLKTFDPEMASAVELRFFAGLDMTETARMLGLPLRTLERRWTLTRAWLFREVS